MEAFEKEAVKGVKYRKAAQGAKVSSFDHRNCREPLEGQKPTQC